MSSILPIYAALASVSVTVTIPLNETGNETRTVTPRVKSLRELPANPPAAQLPMRLLLPFGAGDNEGNMLEYMDRGNNAFVDWRIVDLCLMRPMGEGEGIHTIAETIVNYAGEYSDAMILHRYLDDHELVEITGFTAKPGIFEYPSQSGKLYHGCICTLTVREARINP